MQHLSHFSALEYWNISVLNSIFAENIAKLETPAYLVLNPKDRFFNSEGRTYLCTKKLPPDALDDRHGAVSPYLMFVQLANELDMIELILLGCLLCSRPIATQNYTYIDIKKLQAFVEAAAFIPGRKKALRALRYVKEGAASVMEVFVHLFIGLPNHLGGLGLSGGIFNYKIKLNHDGKIALNQENCFIDYAFPELMIGIEYQSGLHETESAMSFDNARTTALRQMGYFIIPISKLQLYNPHMRKQLFKDIMETFGKRYRIRTQKYDTAMNRIAERLPSKPKRQNTNEQW